jgi:hypothetical protein
MNCQELAERLTVIQPDASATDIARHCLLILNSVNHPILLADHGCLTTALRSANFRLEAAADQHAAMASELEALCQDGPIHFSADQIWTLLRVVKVQNQLIGLYTETPVFI